MKIAVFHNFIDNIGGAEIVSLVLARELGGDIYTTNVDAEKIERMGFSDVSPRVFSIGQVPLQAPWRQQAALWRFAKLNLKNKYDFYIIAGDWAVSGAAKNKPNLWYVHSPIREIWDLYRYVRRHTVPVWGRPLFDLWVLLNRHLNRRYVRDVERIACNSENTRNRVRKYLRREAVVIHPPVDTSRFHCARPRDYWLSVNRLVKHKRVDVQLKAFSRLPSERLIVVGSYEQSRHFLEYAEHCKKIKPSNVEIRSWVTHEELVGLYADCKGFITTSQDEDFGMNVVEAMAAGKMVIAPAEGGYKETVLSGQTGILIEELDANKLREAVVQLGKGIEANPEGRAAICQARARRFDVKVFVEKIQKVCEAA